MNPTDIVNISLKKVKKNMYSHKNKTSVCTGTCGGSKTSLNTVVHKNVKVCMNQYVKFFLKFR